MKSLFFIAALSINLLLFAQQQKSSQKPKSGMQQKTAVTAAPDSRTQSSVVEKPQAIAAPLYSEKFREVAFHASKAIGRIPVLEPSDVIYDERLAEVQKLVDEADLIAQGEAEREVFMVLKAELLHIESKRGEIATAKARAVVNDREMAALAPTSVARQIMQQQGQQDVLKTMQRVSSDLPSKRLSQIEQAIRGNRRLSSVEQDGVEQDHSPRAIDSSGKPQQIPPAPTPDDIWRSFQRPESQRPH